MPRLEAILDRFGKSYVKIENDFFIGRIEERKKQLIKRLVKRLFLKHK